MFRLRKLGGFLTIIGIVIGIIAVVALIAINLWLHTPMTEIEEIDSNRIIISSGNGSGILTYNDLDIIKDIKEIDIVAPISFKTAKIEYKGNERITAFSVMHEDYVEEMFLGMGLYEIEQGNMPKKGDRGNIW